MHILPSRGRPAGLQRFFDEGKPEQPGVVVLERDQLDAYAFVALPPNWKTVVVEKRGGYVASANAAFKAYSDEPWYGMVSDDCVGRTPHWDTILSSAAEPDKIVWPNDLFRGKCTFPVVGGDLCRKLGWFVHPQLWHMYCDTVWGDIQAALGTGGYMPDVVLEHMHYSLKKAKMDDTYMGRIPPRGNKLLGKAPQNYDSTTYTKIKANLQQLVDRCA